MRMDSGGELSTLPFPTQGPVVMLKHSSAWEDFRAYSLYLIFVNIIFSPPASAHGEQAVAEHCAARVKVSHLGMYRVLNEEGFNITLTGYYWGIQ